MFDYSAVLFCLGMILGFKEKQVAACTSAPPAASNPRTTTAPTPTTKLPFCPVTGTLAQAIQAMSCRKRANMGETFAKDRRQRRETIAWPYNCFHAALTYDQGKLVAHMSTHSCCEVCRFPDFTTCVASGASDVETRCVKEALQCIDICIKTHLHDCDQQQMGGKSLARAGLQLATNAPQPRISRPRFKEGRCTIKRKEVEGSYCLERSCIPVDI